MEKLWPFTKNYTLVSHLVIKLWLWTSKRVSCQYSGWWCTILYLGHMSWALVAYSCWRPLSLVSKGGAWHHVVSWDNSGFGVVALWNDNQPCEIPPSAVLRMMTRCRLLGCCWNTHVTGVCVCVCVFAGDRVVNDHVWAPVLMLSSTPIGSHLIVRTVNIYYRSSLGGRSHWVVWPWSWHTFSHTAFLSGRVYYTNSQQ